MLISKKVLWLFQSFFTKAPFNCISKALSSCQSFSSLYIHHPALLHFICRYPELEQKFGPLVLELWLTKQAQHTDAEQAMVMGTVVSLPTETHMFLSINNFTDLIKHALLVSHQVRPINFTPTEELLEMG